MRSQASVETKHAFLFEDEFEALHQASILPRSALWRCLAQTGACNLLASVSTCIVVAEDRIQLTS